MSSLYQITPAASNAQSVLAPNYAYTSNPKLDDGASNTINPST